MRRDSGGISDCLPMGEGVTICLQGEFKMRAQSRSATFESPKSSIRFLLPLLFLPVLLAFGCGGEPPPPIPAAEASDPEQIPAGCAVGERLAAGIPCKWEVADSYVEVKARETGLLDVHVKAGKCSEKGVLLRDSTSVKSGPSCRATIKYEENVLTARGYSGPELVNSLTIRASYQGGAWVVIDAPPSPH